jgi:error-prone DNA polymerase
MTPGVAGDAAPTGADGPKAVGRAHGVGAGTEAPAYAELHAHTNFPLLDGTSDPEAVVTQAAALGLRALAITDHDSIAGIVRFAAEAKRRAVHAIIGVELTVQAPDATPSDTPGAPRISASRVHDQVSIRQHGRGGTARRESTVNARLRCTISGTAAAGSVGP